MKAGSARDRSARQNQRVQRDAVARIDTLEMLMKLGTKEEIETLKIISEGNAFHSDKAILDARNKLRRIYREIAAYNAMKSIMEASEGMPDKDTLPYILPKAQPEDGVETELLITVTQRGKQNA